MEATGFKVCSQMGQLVPLQLGVLHRHLQPEVREEVRGWGGEREPARRGQRRRRRGQGERRTNRLRKVIIYVKACVLYGCDFSLILFCFVSRIFISPLLVGLMFATVGVNAAKSCKFEPPNLSVLIG